MANSVDPDQTSCYASTLFAQAYLSDNRVNTVCEQERARSASKATESDKN